MMTFSQTRNRYVSAPFHSHLTGTRDWEDLWTTLTDYAERFDFSSVELNINLPALNEDYHVNWNRKERDTEQAQWSTEIPLTTGDMIVGRLRVCGNYTESQICVWIGDLISGLKPFETQLISLVKEAASDENGCRGTVKPLSEPLCLTTPETLASSGGWRL